MISKCRKCLESRKTQQCEPLQTSTPTTSPWKKVGTDLITLNGKDYLLTVDYCTNYPIITLLPDTSSSTVITHIKSIFAQHGIPEIVVSDNNPQFASKQYQDFAKQCEFKHITSSPKHPEANGKAEWTVETVKLLQKRPCKMMKILS